MVEEAGPEAAGPEAAGPEAAGPEAAGPEAEAAAGRKEYQHPVSNTMQNNIT